MDNKLDNGYIDNAVEELIKVLGIKEDYSFDPFAELLNSRKIEEAIQLVAKYLRLPIKINLSYVSNTYNPSENNKFESSHLTKTDHAGKGIGGITAQVYIPTYLPPFGSQGLQNYPIQVKVSKDCAKSPYTLVAVIVHELSHILLASLGSRYKDNEIYTDLTPMVLGFSNIVREGRITMEQNTEVKHNLFSSETITHTNTTTYGYLTDEQFAYALNKIKSIQKKYCSLKKRVLKESTLYKNLVRSYERQYFIFHKYLEYIDSHLDQKIDKNDGDMLTDLHQQLHKDTIEATIKINKGKLKHFDEKIDKSHNSTIFLGSLENINSEIGVAKSAVQLNINKIKDNLNILKKYVNTFYKFRLYLGSITMRR